MFHSISALLVDLLEYRDHTPSFVEVKKWVELYFHSSYGPSFYV